MPSASALIPLQTALGRPVDVFDVALLDLDGVVYLMRDPVPGAAAALDSARAAGMRLAFVTNNASRSPVEVTELLHEVGVRADASEVVTSAQAAARVLAERFPADTRVLVVGSAELARQVSERGLIVVDSADDDPEAVVCGYAAEIGWSALAEATVAVNRGAFWLATNTDSTLPSVRGPLPGNGALVGVVATATGQQPHVAGKPDPALHRESVERVGARQPIVVGDRLDTDIEGANRVGCASLLVLSGVSTPVDLLTAQPEHRPTYVAADVAGLLVEPPAARADGPNRWRCGRWTAVADPASVSVTAQRPTTDGAGSDDDLDALRVTAVALWAAAGTEPVDLRALRAGDDDAATALGRWGIRADRSR